MKKQIQRSNQSGFTLFEILVVTILLVTASVAIFRLYGTSSESDKAERVTAFARQLNTVKNELKYSDGKFTGKTSALVAANQRLSNFRRGSSPASYELVAGGVTFDVVPATTTSTDDSLQITTTAGLSDEMCKVVAQSLWDDPVSITINGTAVKSSANAAYDQAAEQAIINACQSPTGDNQMQWVIRG